MPRRRRDWERQACYHITHRCHNREFRFRFEKYRRMPNTTIWRGVATARSGAIASTRQEFRAAAILEFRDRSRGRRLARDCGTPVGHEAVRDPRGR